MVERGLEDAECVVVGYHNEGAIRSDAGGEVKNHCREAVGRVVDHHSRVVEVERAPGKKALSLVA